MLVNVNTFGRGCQGKPSVVIYQRPAGTREDSREGDTVPLPIKVFIVTAIIAVIATHPPLAEKGVPEDLWASGKTGLPGDCHLLV